MKPAQYWRQNKEWQKWLGKRGTVVAATLVRVSAPEQSAFTPYSYVLVEFSKERHEFMGVGHQVFQTGDEVVCVLRKTAVGGNQDLIHYGIKVERLN